jgi:ABC-type uncharacterized transport system permease subunit
LEIAILAPALLFYTIGILFSFFGTTRDSARLYRLSAASLTAAWVFHLVAIVRLGWVSGGVPLANTGEFLLALGWVVLTLHLLVWLRWRVDIAGLVLPPLAQLMVIASIGLAEGSSAPEPHGATSWWFVVHTGASTLGLAALGVAFAMSLIFIVQDRALKSKSSFGLLERLPSLETCDRIGQDAILWGFPLLTLGIVTGFVRSMAVYGTLWIASPKQIFPLVAWVLFALLIYTRLARGIRGRKSAYVTIAAFLIGLLTIVGIAR